MLYLELEICINSPLKPVFEALKRASVVVTVLHLSELLLCLPVFYVLMLKLGVIGVAIAQALRTAADCLAQSIMIHRALRMHHV